VGCEEFRESHQLALMQTGPANCSIRLHLWPWAREAQARRGADLSENVVGFGREVRNNDALPFHWRLVLSAASSLRLSRSFLASCWFHLLLILKIRSGENPPNWLGDAPI